MTVLAFLTRKHLEMEIKNAFALFDVAVHTVESVKDCARRAEVEKFNGIIIDSDPLPFEDALSLMALLRIVNPDAALFVIAQRSDLDQRLRLFEAGVDDCIRGPFVAAELAVRVQHSIRLRQAVADAAASDRVILLRCGDLELDLLRRRATRSGRAIELRQKEFLLLEYLVRNAGRPVTRPMILEHVWNSSFEGLTNLVDVYINALRNKRDRDYTQKLIQTNRGVGYTLASSAAPCQGLSDAVQSFRRRTI
jgi:two-component system, OmpR family, response regulator